MTTEPIPPRSLDVLYETLHRLTLALEPLCTDGSNYSSPDLKAAQRSLAVLAQLWAIDPKVKGYRFVPGGNPLIPQGTIIVCHNDRVVWMSYGRYPSLEEINAWPDGALINLNSLTYDRVLPLIEAHLGDVARA